MKLIKSFCWGGQGGMVFSKRVPPWPPEAKKVISGCSAWQLKKQKKVTGKNIYITIFVCPGKI
jgi:hypothetical protein